MADAFKRLTKTRSIGFDANPISLTEILSHIKLFGDSWLGQQVFTDLILQMDQHVMKLRKDKQEQDKKASKESHG